MIAYVNILSDFYYNNSIRSNDSNESNDSNINRNYKIINKSNNCTINGNY